ncbi:hypothetical protein SOM08_14370 [Hydrogenophaga sp. SNF1]|nr:hypothetical protein [Hydrogenophaga sp. SNF1]WQB82182.1 hypothetical protein SOM08_14370 [Hydrogenophaga sp. SNF1]
MERLLLLLALFVLFPRFLRAITWLLTATLRVLAFLFVLGAILSLFK